jgi:hypothetical protein
MPTLILGPRHTEDGQRLWRAAGELGWKTERLASWRIPDYLRGVPEPVVYAEALFAPALAAELGLMLAEPPAAWLVSLPDEYRKRAVMLTTVGEVRANPAPMFVKPPNDKSFPAAVRTGPGIPAWVPDDTPVLVQEVVEWEVEFRCFVLDRRVRTFSIYLRDGELQKDAGWASTDEEDAELLAFTGRLLADERVTLPRAVVLDAGAIRGRGWAAVELNAAWGSGVYGCDPAAVLEVLRHAAAPAVRRTSPRP